jgi:hypothetical protein
MHDRHLARRLSVQVVSVLAALLLLHQPFPASAQVRPAASLGLLVGQPSGDFADNVSDTGYGAVLTGGIQLPDSPVFLGVELGLLVYGHERRSEAFNTAIPDVRVDVVTDNSIFQSNFFLRLQPVNGKIRPYIDGVVGFKYLYTETAVQDTDGWAFDRIADYVNFDDWAFAYGIGVGAAITLWERGSEPASDKVQVNGVHLDLGLRYMLGTEAEYLKEGSIQRVGGQVTFVPERSTTDMMHPHFQIRVSF